MLIFYPCSLTLNTILLKKRNKLKKSKWYKKKIISLDYAHRKDMAPSRPSLAYSATIASFYSKDRKIVQ